MKSNPIDFDDAHFVTINPEIHSGECTSINDLGKRVSGVSSIALHQLAKKALTRRRYVFPGSKGRVAFSLNPTAFVDGDTFGAADAIGGR